MDNKVPTNLQEQFLKSKGSVEVIVWVNEDQGQFFRFTEEIEHFELTFAFNRFAQGSFIWNDVDGNFFKTFILSGGEKMAITINTTNTSSGDSEIYTEDFVFYAYDIIDKQDLRMDATKNRYEIFFCSPAQLRNYQKRVLRGWLGPRPISDVVEDICVKELEISKKRLHIYRTKNSITNFIGTNRSPKEVIDFLKTMSEYDNQKTFYGFFQNRDGYHFKPISECLKGDPVVALDRTKGKQEETIFLTKILAEDTICGINVLKTLKENCIKRNVVSFNRKEKKTNLVTNNIFSEKGLEELGLLGEKSYYSEDFINNSLDSNYEAYPYSVSFLKINKFYEIYRDMFQRNLFSYKLAGNFLMDVGDLVYMSIQLNAEDYNSALSGIWLILEVKFKWSPNSETNQLGMNLFENEYVVAKVGYSHFMNDCFGQEKLLTVKKRANVFKQ